MGKGSLSRDHSQDLQQLAERARSVAGLVLSVLLLCTGLARAQDCPSEKQLARTSELEHELQPQLGAIRLHRIETLEDDVFTQKSGSKNIESPFFLYQIEQRRFYLKDGQVVENVTAGPFSQYVGISRDGDRIYRLAGFADPEGNFKRLVTDYDLLPPRNGSEAQSRALFCARVVFGHEPQQRILDESQAHIRVSDYFAEHGKDSANQVTRWWHDFRHHYPGKSLNLTTTVEEDGSFLTRLPLFWAPVESDIEPQIRELRVEVRGDGACHQLPETASPSGNLAITPSAITTR